MGSLNRRHFIRTVAASYTAAALQPIATALAEESRPLLGTVARVPAGGTVDAALKRVHDLGLPTCQLFLEELSLAAVEPLLRAQQTYGVKVTAISEHNPGKRIFDFYDGPLTVGIVPPANPNRRARIDRLKLAADVCRRCDIPSIQTHLGFVPEEPSDPIYPQAIAAIREVAMHCKEQGRLLLSETGEETPVTTLRMIQDVGTGNIFVNLDTANLILCGKGNPVDAMDVFGSLVRGMHAKDGLFPTDARNFGQETAIGQGKVDFPRLFQQLKAANYRNAITIEREIQGPQQDEDIRKSKLFLQDLIDKNYG